jgi:hypothetical protein
MGPLLPALSEAAHHERLASCHGSPQLNSTSCRGCHPLQTLCHWKGCHCTCLCCPAEKLLPRTCQDYRCPTHTQGRLREKAYCTRQHWVEVCLMSCLRPNRCRYLTQSRGFLRIYKFVYARSLHLQRTAPLGKFVIAGSSCNDFEQHMQPHLSDRKLPS